MEEELSELSTNCRRFPNAEPFKLWFARLAEERYKKLLIRSFRLKELDKLIYKKDILRNGLMHVWMEYL